MYISFDIFDVITSVNLVLILFMLRQQHSTNKPQVKLQYKDFQPDVAFAGLAVTIGLIIFVVNIVLIFSGK